MELKKQKMLLLWSSPSSCGRLSSMALMCGLILVLMTTTPLAMVEAQSPAPTTPSTTDYPIARPVSSPEARPIESPDGNPVVASPMARPVRRTRRPVAADSPEAPAAPVARRTRSPNRRRTRAPEAAPSEPTGPQNRPPEDASLPTPMPSPASTMTTMPPSATSTGGDPTTLPAEEIPTVAPVPENTLPPTPTPDYPFALRINTGGPEYVDSQGNTWMADDYYKTVGYVKATTHDILNTTDPTLYKTERGSDTALGRQVYYRVPVPPGNYTVHVHFAELFYRQPNRRVFTVNVRNENVYRDLDLYAVTGGTFIPFVVKVPLMEIPEDSISIKLRPLVGNGKISAIEILGFPAANTTTDA